MFDHLCSGFYDWLVGEVTLLITEGPISDAVDPQTICRRSLSSLRMVGCLLAVRENKIGDVVGYVG